MERSELSGRNRIFTTTTEPAAFWSSETEGIPFTTYGMKSKLNWNATTKESELVLEGDESSNATKELIACKLLSVALNRIAQEVLPTKACIDIMRTAVTVKKMKYPSNDRCCLCNRLETWDHRIWCLDRSRAK